MTGNLHPSPALHTVRRFWADEGGASLVEFALVITLFLFLLLAIIDFGRIGHAWVGANKATQLAARLAAVRPPVCPGVPTMTTRPTGGTISNLPFGSLCRAGAGVCAPVSPPPCTSTSPGVTAQGLTTAQEIFAAVQPLVPTTTIGQMRYTYSYDQNLGFLGGPYVPMVTVEFTGVTFTFISQLRFFVTALTGQNSTLGTPLNLPGMSVSLPAEDLALGMDG